MKAGPTALRRVLLENRLATWAAGPTVSSQQNQAAACATLHLQRGQRRSQATERGQRRRNGGQCREQKGSPVYQGLDTAGREGLTLKGQQQDTASRRRPAGEVQKSSWSHIARARSSRRRASSAAALHWARQALPPSPPSGSACMAALHGGGGVGRSGPLVWGKGGGGGQARQGCISGPRQIMLWS